MARTNGQYWSCSAWVRTYGDLDGARSFLGTQMSTAVARHFFDQLYGLSTAVRRRIEPGGKMKHETLLTRPPPTHFTCCRSGDRTHPNRGPVPDLALHPQTLYTAPQGNGHP